MRSPVPRPPSSQETQHLTFPPLTHCRRRSLDMRCQRIMQGGDRAGGEVAGQYEKMSNHMRDKVVASREFSWDFRSNSSPLVSVRPARVVETGRLHKMRKNSLGTHTEAELGGELIFLGASGGHS